MHGNSAYKCKTLKNMWRPLLTIAIKASVIVSKHARLEWFLKNGGSRKTMWHYNKKYEHTFFHQKSLFHFRAWTFDAVLTDTTQHSMWKTADLVQKGQGWTDTKGVKQCLAMTGWWEKPLTRWYFPNKVLLNVPYMRGYKMCCFEHWNDSTGTSRPCKGC